MDHVAYHMEAQRKQRIIERRQDALENLAKKMEEQERERLQTRAGTRSGTRGAPTREATNNPSELRAANYRRLLPPRPEPTHQWRNLQNNHLQHDARSITKPYQGEVKNGINKAYWERTR